jgi:hypothetical protein
VKRLIFAAAATVLVPATAHADVRAALETLKCNPQGRISNADFRDAIVGDSGVPLNQDTARALASGTLGTLALRALKECPDVASCKDKTKVALSGMFKDVGDMFATDWVAPDGYDFRISDQAPAINATNRTPVIRREAFLNGNSDWLEIRCKPEKVAADAGKPTPEPPEPGPFDKLIIGAATSDLSASFAKRGFATLGLTNDNEGDSKTITADILLGFGAFPIARRETLEQVDLTPYIEYERKTNDDRTKELNDLTFGASLFAFEKWGAWSLVAGWQTDDRFNASMTTAQFSAGFPSFSSCARASSGNFTLRCSARIAADYADVGDPGNKPKLATLEQYGRVGADLEGLAVWDLEKAGSITFRAQYQTRRDFTEGDGDAELWTIELGLQPSKASHFNFSIAYTEGEALSSLTPTDQLQLKIGVRK